MKKSGFTLVELIVVVVILAVLSAIAFMTISKWIITSKDTARISDLNTIELSLQTYLYQHSLLPKPDKNILLYASGISNILSYQGVYGTEVASNIGIITKAPKDPTDKTYYTYTVSYDQKKFQLLGLLEGSNTNYAYNDKSYAVDYSTRNVITKGNKLGVILKQTTKEPMYFTGGILTGINLIKTGTNYVAYFSNTGYVNQTESTSLGSVIIPTIGKKEFEKYDSSLVGYRDMETMSGTKLKDWSKYHNDGVGNGVTIGGNLGSNTHSTMFNGVNTYIDMGNNELFNLSNLTIILYVNSNSIQNDYANILSKTNGPNGFLVQQPTGTGPSVFSFQYHDGTSWNTGAPIYLESNTLQQLVFTKNGTIVKSYLNGILVGSSVFSNSNILFSTNSFQIGRIGSWGGARYYNGVIDDVRIYNRALSDEEVEQLYETTLK